MIPAVGLVVHANGAAGPVAAIIVKVVRKEHSLVIEKHEENKYDVYLVAFVSPDAGIPVPAVWFKGPTRFGTEVSEWSWPPVLKEAS